MYGNWLIYGSGLDIFCVIIGFVMLALLTIGVFQLFLQRQRNRLAPRMSVGAGVIAKRGKALQGELTESRNYFVTFEMESGDRMELRLPGWDFWRIDEGDCGRLIFQGSRYIAFVPEKSCA